LPPWCLFIVFRQIQFNLQHYGLPGQTAYLFPFPLDDTGVKLLRVLDTFVWARSEAEYGKSGVRKNRFIEEKESLRWIEGYRNVCRISAGLANTQCVYIGDRESDIYELFIEGEKQSHQADWLIRATQDHRLLDEMKISDALVHAHARAGRN